MKDFFDDLGKKLTETADTVVDKTSRTVEIQKLKSRIRIQERHIEQIYQILGSMLYDKYKEGEVLDSEYADLCRDVQEFEETVRVLENMIEEVRERGECSGF